MIGTMIDTAEADIRLAVQYFVAGQLHTVYRGAAALPRLYTFKNIDFVQP